MNVPAYNGYILNKNETPTTIKKEIKAKIKIITIPKRMPRATDKNEILRFD